MKPDTPPLVIAATLLVARLLLFGYLHVRHRSYSVMRNTVSDYGVGAAKTAYLATSVLSLLAYATIAADLAVAGATPHWLTIVLVVATVGSTAILFFPTDLTGQRGRTRTGVLHWLLAIVNFTALFVVTTNATDYPFLRPEHPALTVVTWLVRITFYGFLLTLVVPFLRTRCIGLTERLFLVAIPVWLITFCLCA